MAATTRLTRVCAEARDEEVCFWVQDTGPGIPSEHLPHIFERYWKHGGETMQMRQLDRVALTRRQMLPARMLSQGQRRRIGLARLRVLRKPLWILDEPATALDADAATVVTFDPRLRDAAGSQGLFVSPSNG